MLMKVGRILGICIITAVALAGPAPGGEKGQSSEKLIVYTVNYPLKYFAERIGGGHVDAVFPAPADVDPAFWTPGLATVAAYQKADLILLNGAGYAKWAQKVSLPPLKTVDTSAAIRDRCIRTKGVVTYSHGSSGEHAHEGVAFTTWIDFDLAVAQAKAVADALSWKRPELRDTFRENFASLERDLDGLDRRMKEISSLDPSRPLIGSHPVYDYLARGYGLNMRNVHWEPDEAPNDLQWGEFEKMREEFPAKWMVWEGDPMKQTVDRLKAAGVGSLVFAPCGNTSGRGDFIGMMRRNVENLSRAFR